MILVLPSNDVQLKFVKQYYIICFLIFSDGSEKPPNQSWTLNYTMTQKACFQQNQTLISPHSCHKNVTGIACTSVFREDIIIEYYKGKHFTSIAFLCALMIMKVTDRVSLFGIRYEQI